MLTLVKVRAARNTDTISLSICWRTGLLSLNQTLSALTVCCVTLLVGFSWRSRRWAPWLMLVSVVCLLGLMSYSIINLL